ncbi:MAG: glutathione S-transferase N-terminal domain-containing protein [Thiomonas sp.]|uniref:glutathione S-transferase family protein n=1 Tax=Thiomonas sp. TaxID=2047785 RepID=UPI002A371810|nr:glutathione S-transferase N-terminal domain-containing protein [Thiomonas sp.]MDY0331530.1 glutathione S-transferase N-terminal domain-containing protein [Thiomonas sp.]
MSVALYYSPGACSFAPHVILREAGVSFELRKFSTADRSNYLPEYLAVNPKGRIPALLIDGFVLTENPAVLAFLGRRFPDARLYPPPGTEAEARCLEWLAWSSNTVHVAFAQILRPERFVSSQDDYQAVQASGHQNFQRCLADIDTHLDGSDFAVKGQFTVVDPFWLVFFRWGVRQGYNMKSSYPAYTRYVESLSQRPSVVAALEAEGISLWA